jgi:hypothetical protein
MHNPDVDTGFGGEDHPLLQMLRFTGFPFRDKTGLVGQMLDKDRRWVMQEYPT